MTEEQQTAVEGEVIPADGNSESAAGTAVTRKSTDIEPLHRGTALSPEAVFELRKKVEKLLDQHFLEGRDYGLIPGTKKKCLLKPGSEFALQVWSYGLVFLPERQRFAENWQDGFLDYSYTAQVIDRRTGKPVAECEGSANSGEKKYVNARKDTWADGNPKEPVLLADQKNTIQKVAQKRAAVGATVLACGLSGQFDHDLEGMDPNAIGGSQRRKNNRGKQSGGRKNPLDLAPTWGKYKDKNTTWREIVEKDRKYVAYLLGENENGEIIVRNEKMADALLAAMNASDSKPKPQPASPKSAAQPERPMWADDEQLTELATLAEERELTSDQAKWVEGVLSGDSRPKYGQMESALLKLSKQPMRSVDDGRDDDLPF